MNNLIGRKAYEIVRISSQHHVSGYTDQKQGPFEIVQIESYLYARDPNNYGYIFLLRDGTKLRAAKEHRIELVE